MKDRRKSIKSSAGGCSDVSYLQTEPTQIKMRPDDVARYIAKMTGELAALAGGAKMQMLTYFLNMARIEAELQLSEAAEDVTFTHRL